MSLVLWSGGCDSTLVLRDLAHEKSTKKEPVRALTIVHNQVGARREQADARAKILAEFRDCGLHIKHIKVSIKVSGPDWAVGGGSFQAMLWLSTAVSILGKGEELYTGHCEEDSVWKRYGQLSSALKGALSALDKDDCEWVTPLCWESKREIIRRLKELKLHDMCWWCESPKSGKRCGQCTPCRMHETALWQMKRWSDVKNVCGG